MSIASLNPGSKCSTVLKFVAKTSVDQDMMKAYSSELLHWARTYSAGSVKKF